MTFLNLSPIEWALVALATALVVGVGALPERRGERAEGRGQKGHGDTLGGRDN